MYASPGDWIGARRPAGPAGRPVAAKLFFSTTEISGTETPHRLVGVDPKGRNGRIESFAFRQDIVHTGLGAAILPDLLDPVVHFTDQTWFDRTGNFHSEGLHVVERYSLVDANHIDYEVTIEDPEVFTQPWTMRMTLYRRTEPNFQLLEYDCYAFEWEQYYPYPGL